MRKFVAIIIAMMCIVLSSCVQHSAQHRDNRPFRVAVIHSYSSTLESYDRYNTILLGKFRGANMRTDMRVFYLEATSMDMSRNINYLTILDTLHSFKPDVLLFEDDLATRTYLDTENVDSLIASCPKVLGNVHMPEKGEGFTVEKLRERFPNLAVQIADLDYAENIRVANELYPRKTNLVEIELDHTPLDSAIRMDIREQIKSEEFYDDLDFHDMFLSNDDLNERLKGRIVVLGISIANPEKNYCAENGEDEELGIARTEGLVTYSVANPQLVVKKDAFAPSLVVRGQDFGFTLVNVDFGSSEHRWLAGYFAPVETVARDMGDYAIRVLDGEDAGTFEVLHHKIEYMFDWATRTSDPKYKNYDDFADKYTIVNAPFYVAHEKLYFTFIAMAMLMVAIASVVLVRMLNKRLNRPIEKMLAQLARQQELIDLVFTNISGASFTFDGKIFVFSLLGKHNRGETVTVTKSEFMELVTPDNTEKAEKMFDDFRTPGSHITQLSVIPRATGAGRELSLQFISDVTKGRRRQLLLTGVVLDATKTKEQIEQYRKAQLQAENTRMKSQFLRDLNRQVSEPLNQILTYSHNIADVSRNEDIDALRTDINSLNAQSIKLMDIVNGILEVVRMESGRVPLDIKPCELQKVLNDMKFRNDRAVRVRDIIFPKLTAKQQQMLLKADYVRLEQLLDALVAEVADMGQDGPIGLTISYNSRQKELTIHVSSRGNGAVMTRKQYNALRQFFKRDFLDLSMGIRINLANVVASNMNSRIAVEMLTDGVMFSVAIPVATISREAR